MSTKATQTDVNGSSKDTQNENGCLRSSQRLLIKEMLNFNKPLAKGGGNGTSSIWKVLIMDSCAQSILAPIISVNELRGEGVTLYLPLAVGPHAQRDPIPEVPAIYLVEASKHNMELITKDIVSGLYLKYYINFIGTITRSLLESFAQALIGADSRSGGGALHPSRVSFAPQVQSIFDQYISFICLDRSLWILPTPSTGAAASMEYNVLCIFSSMLAMSWLPSGGNGGNTELIATPPLIVYPKEMEEMAQLLTEKIKGHLVNTKYTPKTQQRKSARPVIVLQQRGFDLSAPLLMPMTYHSLVHDLLGNHLNRVEFVAADGATKVMDLDYSDPLWREWGPLAFPDVAAKVDQALSAYKEDMSKVMKGGGAGAGGASDPSLDSDMTPEQLRTAVTRLPELAERKKLIDNHLQLCTLILELIKKGGLGDVFPFIGQGGIMAPSGTMVHLENQAGRELFFSLLGPSSPCAFGNRLRLFSLAWICLPIHASNMSNSSLSLLNNVEKWLEDSCVCALRNGCPDLMVDEFELTVKNLKSHRCSLKRAAAEEGVYAVSPSADQSYPSPDLGASSKTSLPPLHSSGNHSASNPNCRSPTPSDQTSKGNVIRGALFQGVKSLMATVGDSVAMGGVFGGAWGGGSTWNNGLTDDVVGMGRSLPILRYLQQSLSRWRLPGRGNQHHQHNNNNNLSVIDCTGKDLGDQEEELDSDCLPPAILLYMDGGVTWGEWDQLQLWSQHQLGKVQQKFGTTKISGSTDRHQWLTLGSTKMLRGSKFLKEYFE